MPELKNARRQVSIIHTRKQKELLILSEMQCYNKRQEPDNEVKVLLRLPNLLDLQSISLQRRSQELGLRGEQTKYKMCVETARFFYSNVAQNLSRFFVPPEQILPTPPDEQ